MNGVEYVRELCKKQGITISALEKELKFSNGYLNPKKMEYLPYDRAVLVQKKLGGDITIMTGVENEGETNLYYLNDDTKEIAQFMFENPGHKVLLDAVRKTKGEDVEFIKELIERVTNNYDE